MSAQNSELHASMMKSPENLMELVTQHAEKLKDVLESEYTALMTQDIDSVNSLTAEKTALLDSLARMEPQLRVIYNMPGVQTGHRSVQELLTLCSELNSRNRTLVMLAIDQNRKTLSLLRGVLKLDSTSVYSSNGALDADQSKRYLGKA